jgi:siderophore synthetase component
MKVIDLGHGGLAIEPESPADSVRTLSHTQLQQSKVSDEAIKIYNRYIERTSSATRTLPVKTFSIE